MNIDKFYQSRKQEWDELNRLIERAQRNLSQMNPQELELLSQRYRAATSDLALARRDHPRHAVTRYLNQLVARAHAVIYQGEPLGVSQLVDFALRGFPRLFRETLPFTLLAMFLFFMPAIASGISVYVYPDSARWLLPASVQDLIPTVEEGKLWIDLPPEKRSGAASYIMRNNIQVTFLAFASGISAGLFTVWVLVMNGLILGGLTGLTAHYGIGWNLWNFVIGHGVVELSVIFIAGGSGLMMGYAMLRPGLMRRRDSLIVAAQKAVWLMLGAAPFLVLAGLIEGFISPAENIPVPFKWLVGIVTGILFYSYLFGAGHTKKDRFGNLISS